MAKKVKKKAARPQAVAAKKGWSDKDLARLEREFSTCKSVTVLAKQMGRTPGAVRQKAHAMDLHRREPVKPKRKATPKTTKPAKKAAARKPQKAVLPPTPKKARPPRKKAAGTPGFVPGTATTPAVPVASPATTE